MQWNFLGRLCYSNGIVHSPWLSKQIFVPREQTENFWSLQKIIYDRSYWREIQDWHWNILLQVRAVLSYHDIKNKNRKTLTPTPKVYMLNHFKSRIETSLVLSYTSRKYYSLFDTIWEVFCLLMTTFRLSKMDGSFHLLVSYLKWGVARAIPSIPFGLGKKGSCPWGSDRNQDASFLPCTCGLSESNGRRRS